MFLSDCHLSVSYKMVLTCMPAFQVTLSGEHQEELVFTAVVHLDFQTSVHVMFQL